MKTKLITVTFSRQVTITIPDDATVESLNEGGAHDQLGFNIVSNAADDINHNDGYITEIEDEEHDELTMSQIGLLQHLVTTQSN